MKEEPGGARAGPGPARRSSGAPDETLTTEDLLRLSEVLEKGAGIRLPPHKRQLAESRLWPRARELGHPTLRDYCESALSDEGSQEERQRLIDALTTNKTSFFREPHHFEYLARKVLPGLGRGSFTAWSAGCSTGEEPWTLAIVLAEHARRLPGFDFTVLATDVSRRVLEYASRAVYTEADASAIPAELRRRYLLKSRDAARGLVKIVPELRRKVQFTRANLVADEPEIEPQASVVFCRNVMIYFDRQTQHLLVSRLLAALPPGGFLFLGHSEALLARDWPLESMAPTTYRRRREQ